MDEIYTCKCGNQMWEVYNGNEIVCSKCKTIYRLTINAKEFNIHRKDMENIPNFPTTQISARAKPDIIGLGISENRNKKKNGLCDCK